MDKTLYISDLDGTLLQSDASLSEETVRDVNAAVSRGAYFTFATARSVYSAAPITERLDINIPCILMNGVSIYDLAEKRYITNEFIPTDASAEIIRAFRENDLHCFMYKIHSGVLTCYYSEVTTKVMRSFAEVRKNNYHKPFVRCDDLLDEADGETVYFTATDSYERLLPVKNAVSAVPGASHAFYADTYTDEWYLEVFSDRASKANAVRKLREMYGFDRIVCFGDNLNDLPMFSVSDVRIAVGNARQETKDAADIIIAPNSENGVASWLRENFRASGLL